MVATDDRRIYDCVSGFDGRAVMTSKKHRSGTDRIAEALTKIETRSLKFGTIVNIQGDEPLIDPKAIDLLAKVMLEDKNLEMATLVGGFKDKEELLSPNTAKVVADDRGSALYFSRAVIPYSRESDLKILTFLKHIGIYAYRRETLFKLISRPQSALEKIEKLEQLRAVECGVKIRLIKTSYHPLAVDTPADLAQINKVLMGQSFA